MPRETPNPKRSGIHTRGYLPHVKAEGATYFVTIRLADSMPKEVLLKFEAEKAEQVRRIERGNKMNKSALMLEINREHQRNIERYLDPGAGACHLRKPEIADLVANAFKFFDKQRYDLMEWVVMPNHAHVVVWPKPTYLLSDIVKSWKQYSSRRAKKMLGLGEEPFWQPESYDHWIRDDEEKVRACNYVRRNPVIAKLCKTPEDWRWSSASNQHDSDNSNASEQ